MAYKATKEEKDLLAKQADFSKAAETLNYDDTYAKEGANLFAQYQNMEPFSYDATKDPTYQQFARSYTQQGRRAMQDTMGQAAAMTGGYGNSYAQTAAQQSYNQYMSALADKIPELQELAYGKYRDKKNDLVTAFGMASQMDETRYGRATDEQKMALALAQLYGDQANATRTFNYGVYRDGIDDRRYAEQIAYTQKQDAIANKLAQDKFDFDKQQSGAQLALSAASAGFEPDGKGGWNYVGGNGSDGSVDPFDFETYESILATAQPYATAGQASLANYLDGLILPDSTYQAIMNAFEEEWSAADKAAEAAKSKKQRGAAYRANQK